MTSVVLVDSGGAVVEYMTTVEDPRQEGECEEGDVEAEVEVEVEVEGDMLEEETDEDLDEEENPAVIVEEVPGRGLEQYFSAHVLVYDDGTYLIQDVGEDQEVETEVVETGERPGWDVHTGLGLHISSTIYLPNLNTLVPYI
ncbi:ETS-related transcription factor Elf-2-like, partial [Oncorhynchus masou masou]|uniref:ETS-related transcription factor Elf-2-like n=1 Tax=Oncorhynchus masou masou TaxID=90313 RepID=UPI003183364D